MAGAGSKDNPWKLKTPPGTSEYVMYQDETADPPALVCQVGKTELRYHLRCLDDLREMLRAHGDWMPLGSADEQKPPLRAPSRRGPGRPTIRSAAGTACARATGAGSRCTCRR